MFANKLFYPTAFVLGALSAFAQSGISTVVLPGVTIQWSTVAEPPLPNNVHRQAHFTFAGNIVQRYEFDPATNTYFGYDLMAEPSGFAEFRVAIVPLTLRPQELPDLERGRSSTLTILALPKYPPPQLVHFGDTIALDLLVSPDGKQKIVDYLKFLPAFGNPPLHFDQRHFLSLTPQRQPISRDFTLDDVRLNLQPPLAWFINGQELATHQALLKISGSVLWFYYPSRGLFVLSLAPRLDSNFRKSGTIHDHLLRFEWQGDQYEIRSSGLVLGSGQAWNVYLRHDPDYRPSTSADTLMIGSGFPDSRF